MESRINNIGCSLETGVGPLLIPEPLQMNEWGNTYFYLSEGTSSITGPWESLPYQVAWLNWFGNDDIEIVDCMKGARLGYTKCIMIACGYFIEHKKRDIVIYQPTDDDAQDFTISEINTMLVDVPILGDQLRCKVESQSPFNTNSRKEFYHSALHIRGGKSAKNYRRITKDVVIYEEVDGFDWDIDGEGSPLTLGDTRVETSSFPKSLRGTTPKIKGMSHIEDSLESADMVMRRYLPCVHCGSMDFLRWENMVFDADNLTEARMRCEFCDKLYSYADYPAMDKTGRWQSDAGEYYDEQLNQFFDAGDSPIPPPRHLGIRIWSAYSYFYTWTKLASAFLAARKKQKEGDLSKLKTFTNTKLGETWVIKGQSIEETAFDDRLEDWSGGVISNKILCITMMVDVQGGKNARLELEIVGWGEGEESWSLVYEKIEGDPEFPEVWEELEQFRRLHFTREDGIPLNVACTCIDSGFKSTAVYKYTTPRQRKPHRVYATKGHSTPWKPMINTPSKVGPRKRTLLYMVGTEVAKESLFSRLRLEEPGPGYCHFPLGRSSDYFKQLANEELKTTYKKGKKFMTFQKKDESAPNEALDLRVGNMVALAILSPSFAYLKRRYSRMAGVMAEQRMEFAAAEPTETEPAPARPTKKASRRNTRKKGWVNGWR